jgi:hypothetical protein
MVKLERWRLIQKVVLLKNIRNANSATTDASQLILTRDRMETKEILGNVILKLIPLPRPYKIIGGAIDLLQEQADVSSEREKQKFIDRKQRYWKDVEKAYEKAIFHQTYQWLKEIEKSKDPAKVEERIVSILEIEDVKSENTDPRIVPERKYLSEIMKPYWDIHYPVARFTIPAMQAFSPKNLNAVPPLEIKNWEDILNAIKQGDPGWTTIKGRPIEIIQGEPGHRGTERLYFETLNEKRHDVETLLYKSRKLLEDNLPRR